MVSKRYQCLTKRHGIKSNREQVISVIAELNIPQSEWQVGKTKVFLRSVVHEPLEVSLKKKQVAYIDMCLQYLRNLMIQFLKNCNFDN